MNLANSQNGSLPYMDHKGVCNKEALKKKAQWVLQTELQTLAWPRKQRYSLPPTAKPFAYPRLVSRAVLRTLLYVVYDHRGRLLVEMVMARATVNVFWPGKRKWVRYKASSPDHSIIPT